MVGCWKVYTQAAEKTHVLEFNQRNSLRELNNLEMQAISYIKYALLDPSYDNAYDFNL